MYAAVPRIIPARVGRGDVIVGEWPRSASAARAGSIGSIALARPKSRTLTAAVGRDLDVGRLQVAMDDAPFVRGLERLGDLAGDRGDLVPDLGLGLWARGPLWP